MQGPTRQCRICRLRAAKATLTRWVHTKDGYVQDTKAPGRGYYSCSQECAEKLVKYHGRK